MPRDILSVIDGFDALQAVLRSAWAVATLPAPFAVDEELRARMMKESVATAQAITEELVKIVTQPPED